MTNNKTRHKSSVALVLIDVINHFEFPDGDRVLANALPIAIKLARLKARARRAGIPTIYVNDNFGQWRSDAAKLVDYCLQTAAPGKPFVEKIRPDDEDYFVLKPMHSVSSRRRLKFSCGISGRRRLSCAGSRPIFRC